MYASSQFPYPLMFIPYSLLNLPRSPLLFWELFVLERVLLFARDAKLIQYQNQRQRTQKWWNVRLPFKRSDLPNPSLLDTSRVGKIPQHPDSAESLRVIEVDLAELKLLNSSSSVWPESAPQIDGVIICYDASDAQSFTHVEKLTRLWRLLLAHIYHSHLLSDGFQRMMLPTVVMACKSDMDSVINPQATAAMLYRYQVGLVEVTTHERFGKDKMRRCFEWMIQSVYRKRSKPVRLIRWRT